MKRMLRVIGLIAALACVFAFTACRGGGSGGGGAAEISLRATWDSYLKSSSETELCFLPSDYDGNGTQEAYGITGSVSSDGYANNVKIYFVSSAGKISCVKDSAYGGGALFGKLQNYEKLASDTESVFLNCGSQKFIIWEIDGGGSSSVSVILGVRNGASYQPKASGKYQWFHKNADGTYTGTTSDFSNGYHEYIDHTFTFNAAAGEFEETGVKS